MAKLIKLPYSRQCIDDDDIAAVVDVLRGDWLTTGPSVVEFERQLAQYCGAEFAVACASGTAALHLACLAAGVTPGTRVVVPAITFLATANCARFCGADVTFTDVDPDSANMGGTQFASALGDGKAVSAVIPVHFGGHPVDLERIYAIAVEQGVSIIEDACHSLGASYKSTSGERVRVGSCRHSHMAVFSFHSVKHIAMGEGGAITTNDPAVYERLLRLRNHGMERDSDRFVDRELGFIDLAEEPRPNPWYYEMQSLGWNYRLTDIQCALGISQLRKLDRFIERRRQIAARYDQLIPNRFGTTVQPLDVAEYVDHAYHLYVVRIPFGMGIPSRAEVMRALAATGVGSQVHYIPLYRQPYYRALYNLSPDQFPNAEAYYSQCLSLPMFPKMSDAHVEAIVDALANVLNERRRS